MVDPSYSDLDLHSNIHDYLYYQLLNIELVDQGCRVDHHRVLVVVVVVVVVVVDLELMYFVQLPRLLSW